MKDFLRRIARSAGYDIRRYLPTNSPDAQIKSVLDRFGIDLVLDVGANMGQYGRLLRDIGYRGSITSFEPLRAAHAALTLASAQDRAWSVAPRTAIGREDGEIVINVAANSASSSVLPMLQAHLTAAPESVYAGTESVPLQRLDSAVPNLSHTAALYLKIDTQGYEMAVLDGAGSVLDQAAAVQIEMSLTPLYDGGATFEAIMARMHGAGLTLWALWPGFNDPASGRLLQIDAIFARAERLG